MDFLGSVFSDHPFFRAIVSTPTNQSLTFPTTKHNTSKKVTRTLHSNSKNESDKDSSQILDSVPVGVILPKALEPVIVEQQARHPPEQILPKAPDLALQPIPDESEATTDEASLVRSFFDVVYRGKVSVLQGFLKRNAIDINCLTPQSGSKRFRGVCRSDGWGALHLCAWLNHVEMIEYLFSQGAIPDLRNMWEQSALHVATCRGNYESVKKLLELGANVNLPIPRRQNQIPFHIACICGHPKVAQILKDWGATILVDNQNTSGPTSSLQLAIQRGNPSVVQIVLTAKPSFKIENGRHPLDLYIGNNEIFVSLIDFLDNNPSQLPAESQISTLLLSKNIDLIKGSRFLYSVCKKTPLASVVHYIHLLHFFLKEKIDDGSTSAAFYSACVADRVEAAEALLAAGANINYVKPDYFIGKGTPCIIAAVKEGHVSVVRFMLEKGVDTRVRTETDATLLHLAVSRGFVELCQMLLGRVDINAVDDNGQTVLHIAAANDSAVLIELLVQNGAQVNFPNTKRQGISPLHVAAAAGRNEALKMLIHLGADVNQKKTRNVGPQTALDMARESSYKTTERLLLEAGAIDHRKQRKKDMTSLHLLSFDDVVPVLYNYPKTCPLPSFSMEEVPTNSKSQRSSQTHGSGGSWQTIRLFISSTFTDMNTERDYLIKSVVPILKQRAAQRRLHLVEVDLRWGVTEEEAKTGRTLEICLSEVDNCVIFAGLLGEKYGWVPNEREVRDDIKVRYDWVEGLSITELEIRRAINNQRNGKCYTSFYIRDPTSTLKVPPQYRLQFQDAKNTEISRLKDLVTKSGFPVVQYQTEYGGLDREGQPCFKGIQTFGDAFISHVWKSIEEAFLVREEEPSELELEGFYHDQFIAHRTKNFVGRKDKVKELEKYVKANSSEPLVVSGLAGSGKSALMSYFTRYLSENSSCFVLPHFVGASPNSTDIMHLLRRLCMVLIVEYGLWVDLPEDLDYTTLVEKFNDLLKLVSKELGSKKCVIIIDAINQLDEDRNKSSQMKWLPVTLPHGIRIIVSCLGGDCLEVLKSRNHPIFEIGELSIKDRQEIVTTLLQQHNKKLDSSQMKNLFSKKDVTEPLYLVICCQELRLHGIFEKLNQKINDMSPTLIGLLDQVLERLEIEQGSDLIRDTLSLLQTSRHGLMELELIELLGANSSTWGSLSLSLSLFLRPMGREGQLDFFHRQIAKAVQRRFLKSDATRTEYHKRLGTYYLRKCDPLGNFTFGVTTLKPGDQDPCFSALNELVYHLIQGKNWGDLEKTLSSLYFIQRRSSNGQIFKLVSDFSLLDDCVDEEVRDLNVIEFKRFIQTHAPQLALNPETALQLALNQTLSSFVGEEAKRLIRQSKSNPPFVEWVNRPSAGDSGFLFLYMASLDVNDVAFSPDEKLIISVQKDGSCSLWSTQTGEEVIKHLNHKDRSGSCRFSPNGQFYLSASQDGKVNIYNTETKQLVHQLIHTSGANGSNWSPNGKLLAVSLDEGSIVIYDSQSFSKFKTLSGHKANALCLSWSPDGEKLVSGSSDKNLIIWDINSGKQTVTLVGHSKPVKNVHWAPSGSWILSCSQDKTMNVWDTKGAILQTITGHKDNVESCSISPDERYIASASWDRSGVLWKKDDHQTKFQRVGEFPGTSHFLNAVAFSPNGAKIALGSPDKSVKLFYTKTATTPPPPSPSKFHSKIISGLDFLESSGKILSASWDKTVKLHQLNKANKTISTIATFTGHSKRANECLFLRTPVNPGQNFISCSMDQTLKMFDVTSREDLLSFNGHTNNVFVMDISHDARYLVSGSQDKSIRLWDVETGEEVITLNGHEDWVTSVCFSPFSRRLATGSHDGMIKVWNTETGDQIESLEGHTNCVLSIVYSPDGKHLVSGSEDHTIIVWDAHTLQMKRKLKGHLHEICCVRFFKGSNQFIASGSSDKTVRIWNIETGEQVWVYHCEGGIFVLHPIEGNDILVGDSAGQICLLELHNIKLT